MALFKSYRPDAESIGVTILPIIDGMGERAKPYLEKYGLHDIDPQRWYPQQQLLDVLQDIALHESSSLDMVAIGIHAIDTAILPPDIDSIESALMAASLIYQMNNRNDSASLQVTLVDQGHAVVVSNSPFPAEFEYGVAYGFVKRFRKPNERFTVAYDLTAPNRSKGDDSTTYIIKWG